MRRIGRVAVECKCSASQGKQEATSKGDFEGRLRRATSRGDFEGRLRRAGGDLRVGGGVFLPDGSLLRDSCRGRLRGRVWLRLRACSGAWPTAAGGRSDGAGDPEYFR